MVGLVVSSKQYPGYKMALPAMHEKRAQESMLKGWAETSCAFQEKGLVVGLFPLLP